jgi:hypothetical protein
VRESPHFAGCFSLADCPKNACCNVDFNHEQLHVWREERLGLGLRALLRFGREQEPVSPVRVPLKASVSYGQLGTGTTRERHAALAREHER